MRGSCSEARALAAVERLDAPTLLGLLVQVQPYCSKHFVRITLQRKGPGGGMAYAGDLQ